MPSNIIRTRLAIMILNIFLASSVAMKHIFPTILTKLRTLFQKGGVNDHDYGYQKKPGVEQDGKNRRLPKGKIPE
jgi:hypothetical protein